MNFSVCVPWHNPDQLREFLIAWGFENPKNDHSMLLPQWLLLEKDEDMSGCAKTKNRAIEHALELKSKFIVVLDSDVYPHYESKEYTGLEDFARVCINAMTPQEVEMFEVITDPPSRGTPYRNRTISMPVAATMSFWKGVPDLDAPSQLVYGDRCEMTFRRKAMYGRMFPFSGMACAFRSEFWPHFKFDETADRYDDIYMGYRLCAEAYKRGYCINLNGPLVRHVRQSNVWNNLKIEAENMERNETEWQQYVK